MRAVIQRVLSASVSIDGEVRASIQGGIMALAGFAREDTRVDLEYIARKIIELRIFEDSGEKMNLSLGDTGGGLLLVPQFTLYGDARKGRRPSFSTAMEPVRASRMFEEFMEICAASHGETYAGVFGANMQVGLVNNGPVTIILDSTGLF
jgi:D-tyrosyl-tRNA(Tyr) deacylase